MTSLPLRRDESLQRDSLLSSVMLHLVLLRPTPVQLWLLLHADIRKGPPGAKAMTENVQLASCRGLGHLSAAKLKLHQKQPHANLLTSLYPDYKQVLSLKRASGPSTGENPVASRGAFCRADLGKGGQRSCCHRQSRLWSLEANHSLSVTMSNSFVARGGSLPACHCVPSSNPLLRRARPWRQPQVQACRSCIISAADQHS